MKRFAILMLSLFLAGPVVAEDSKKVTLLKTDGRVDFLIGDELVTTYHIGPDVAKPYFWPVNAPGGVPATRGWPMEKAEEGGTTDHVHQKSMWFCHGDVIPHGLEVKDKIRGVDGVDFWSESKGHGKMIVKSIEIDGPVLSSVNEWTTADGAKILDEKRVVRLIAMPKGRLFVIDSELMASNVPVTFGDTKEGSMGVRVHDQLREKGGNGRMTSSNGQTGERAIWGRFADWIDYSGEVDGKPVGVAVFDDPDNRIRSCWHARGYGLLAANPFGRKRSGFPDQKEKEGELVELKKGETLKFRYGVYVHTGDVAKGDVKWAFDSFRAID